MNKKFIFCTDENLADELVKYYKLISKTNQFSIFENIPIGKCFDFSNIDKSKFTYTNKLLF